MNMQMRGMGCHLASNNTHQSMTDKHFITKITHKYSPYRRCVACINIMNEIICIVCDEQGPDFDDMSSFFPCEIDDAIQYINLGYGAQAPKIVNL